jgi:hypothetical protein
MNDTKDPSPLRRVPRCLDCGQGGHLNAEGVCPACHTERMLDLEQHYAEREK